MALLLPRGGTAAHPSPLLALSTGGAAGEVPDAEAGVRAFTGEVLHRADGVGVAVGGVDRPGGGNKESGAEPNTKGEAEAVGEGSTSAWPIQLVKHWHNSYCR